MERYCQNCKRVTSDRYFNYQVFYERCSRCGSEKGETKSDDSRCAYEWYLHDHVLWLFRPLYRMVHLLLMGHTTRKSIPEIELECKIADENRRRQRQLDRLSGK